MAGTVSVRPARSKRELRTFTLYPWRIYRGKDSYFENWVPPLVMDEKHQFDREKNPFYKHAEAEHFLAWDGDQVVGRISGILDQNYVQHQNEKTAFFGFYESVDRTDVAQALMDAAFDFAKAHGATKIIGPINLSTNHILGCQIDAFDTPPIIQMGYNAPYYPGLFEAVGLKKEKDLLSYRMTTETLQLSDKIRRVTEIVRKRQKVELRKIDMKDWDELVDIVRDIWNDAWAHNWGFVPWTEEEFSDLAKDMKMVLIPEMILVAYIEGKPVGFAFPIPDMNQVFIKMNGRLLPTGLFQLLLGRKKVNEIRVAAFGVRPEYQNRGIDALFIYELYTRAPSVGIDRAEFSWILENNLNLRNLLENWGAFRYKTHRIYSADLG